MSYALCQISCEQCVPTLFSESRYFLSWVFEFLCGTRDILKILLIIFKVWFLTETVYWFMNQFSQWGLTVLCNVVLRTWGMNIKELDTVLAVKKQACYLSGAWKRFTFTEHSPTRHTKRDFISNPQCSELFLTLLFFFWRNWGSWLSDLLVQVPTAVNTGSNLCLLELEVQVPPIPLLCLQRTQVPKQSGTDSTWDQWQETFLFVFNLMHVNLQL